MRALFEQHRPQVVFHAAAFKHVPLMEANPLESVRNNALATRSLAQVARDAGVERFVLISTDKAVEPQTVMGQSKALCEWIVESLGAQKGNGTKFIAVRFGNVLGSSGSVIPIFRRQIEKGGPVTVTDPEMTRYFMTIPEAVSLVVQAGGMGASGQVFVLDMGKPVKIIDLAQNMIRLSGKEPGRDIEIVYSGIRPGEKLHEELWGEHETVSPTKHPKIRKLTCPAIDAKWLDSRAGGAGQARRQGRRRRRRQELARITRGAQRLEKKKAAAPPRGRGERPTQFRDKLSRLIVTPRRLGWRCGRRTGSSQGLTPSSGARSCRRAGRSASSPAPARARRPRSRAGSPGRWRAAPSPPIRSWR